MLANGTATAPVTVDGSGRGADLLAELGQRLRQVRKAKGLTLADVSDHLQIHYSAVSRLERGEYHSATPHLIARTERFLKLAAAEGYEPWFIDWIAVEETATKLDSWEPTGIPGLFQTEPYARCVLRGAFPGRPLAGIEQQARARLDRQLILRREEPAPPFIHAVIGEAAIRRRLGGSAVMAEQLRHLLDLAEYDRITVQVLELASKGLVGQLAPFVIASFSDGHPDVAHLDNALSGLTTPEPGPVAELTRQYLALAQNALGPEDSADLIRGVLGEWTD